MSWSTGCYHTKDPPGGAPDVDTDGDSDIDADGDGDSDGDTDPVPCNKGVWEGDFTSSDDGDNTIEMLFGYTEMTGNLNLLPGVLEDLLALECLKSIGGSLRIQSTDLISLSGLDSLESVAGTVVIAENIALPDLEGLGSLSSVGSFYVRFNDALVSVDGVESLKEIHGDLDIFDNPLLADLGGLDGLIGSPLTLSIQDNPELPNCEATGLRDRLEELPESVCVQGNQPDECPDDTETCP